MRINSIRLRLTLWYAFFLATTLGAIGVATYLYMHTSLYTQLEHRLDAGHSLLERTIRQSPGDLFEVETHSPLRYFRVTRGGRNPFFASRAWVLAGLDDAQTGSPVPGIRQWQSPQGRYFLIKQTVLESEGRTYHVSCALDSEVTHQSLNKLFWALVIGIPFAVFISLGGGYLLARRALAPLQRITARSQAISSDNLSERLDIANPQDELGQLSLVLNDAFSRLEQSFGHLKRFTHDAAHELRTPLAVLRSVGEHGLQGQRESAAYREVIGSMLEEVERLGQLVDGLLTLARAESGRFAVEFQTVDVQSLCQEVIECLRVLSEDKHQNLHFVPNQCPDLQVDRNTLRLALMNLIANAIRFTPTDGTIEVSCNRNTHNEVVIEVSDNGPGIPPEHHAHLFDRFYRVDTSRSQETGGTGLGLAIAKWAVGINGGRIELDSEPGRGSRFRIILPVSASNRSF